MNKMRGRSRPWSFSGSVLVNPRKDLLPLSVHAGSYESK